MLRLLVLVSALHLSVHDCATLTHEESLYDTLFTNYNPYLLPVLDHNTTIVVQASAAVVGINKFDEINGEIDITCVFYLKWQDERLTWTPSDFGGKTSMLVHSSVIWQPLLYLLQSYEKIQIIGNAPQYLRLYSNGTVTWVPANVLKVICSVDVTYFPFDSQTCNISVSTWLFSKEELKFVITNRNLDLSSLSLNSQWHVESGEVSNTSAIPSTSDLITVQINLRRRSEFFLVYIILPVIFLGIINNLVFVMPASSGERTSVAMTSFLSFIVSMEMVNINVPESSSPLAYIFYYILFLLVYSSCIIFLVIISLRIHDREDRVSNKVQTLIKYLRFWRSQCCKKTPVSSKEVRNKDNDVTSEFEVVTENIVLENASNITWKIVGSTFDKYCFWTLGIIFYFYTGITFSRLYNNIGLKL